MSKILLVQNSTREGPGLLSQLLAESSIDYDLIDLDAGEIFPDPTAYDALVVFGGPDSANDTTDKMLRELEMVKKALDASVPYLGICLGLQVGVKAAGGAVVKNHVKEVGLHAPDGTPYSVALTDIALTEAGMKDPLFVELQDEFRVFQLHGETVELTDTMQLLATGRDCRNQIVKLQEKAFGIQSHFELTPEMLDSWLAADPDFESFDTAKIKADFMAVKDEYTQTGLALLRNFLKIAGLL